MKLEKSNHPVLAASFELLGEVNSITVTVSLSVMPKSGWTDLVLKTTKLLVCRRASLMSNTKLVFGPPKVCFGKVCTRNA